MHIGVISTSYPRGAGDPAGSFVHGLNGYLRRQGHRVTVVCAGEADSPLQAELDGVSVHRVPSPLFFQGGAPDALATGLVQSPLPTLWEASRFSLQLGAVAARQLVGCDALLSHWLAPCGMTAALLQGRRPHVAVAHSSDIHLLRRLRGSVVARWLSRRAQLVYSAEHLRLDGAPGQVVPMGIHVAEFAPSEPLRQQARQALGLSRPTVLFLGRLVPVKGLAVLLAALDRLNQLQPVELLVAGDGPLRTELMREVIRNGLPVRFVGEVSGPRKRELLWAADALVLPSLQLADGRTEGSPVVVWEALAAGCPVVASRVGGVAAQLAGAGLLVPPGDAVQLAEALHRVLTQPELANQLRTQGLGRALSADWSQVAPQLERFLL